jgi:hypothetical protein
VNENICKSKISLALTLHFQLRKYMCLIFIPHLSFYGCSLLFSRSSEFKFERQQSHYSDVFEPPTLPDSSHTTQTFSSLQHLQIAVTLFKRFPTSNTYKQQLHYSEVFQPPKLTDSSHTIQTFFNLQI